MTQPNTWLLRDRIERIRSELSHLEIEMLGRRFAGNTADEVKELGTRLHNLGEPDKGRDDLRGAVFPGVEVDRAA